MRYFITRHKGAAEWAAQTMGGEPFELVAQADDTFFERLRPGDVVAGTLPVALAARVCARGARLLFLTMELPAEARGKELTAADMRAYNARLEEYVVLKPEAATTITYNDGRQHRGRYPMLVIVPDDGSALYKFSGQGTSHVRIVKADYQQNGKWSNTTYALELRNARGVELTQAWESPHAMAESLTDLAAQLAVDEPRALAFARAHLLRTISIWARSLWPEEIEETEETTELPYNGGTVTKVYIPKWDVHLYRWLNGDIRHKATL